MASLQKQFEADVKKLKAESDKLKLVDTSTHFDYGKDPQRPKNHLGIRKSLPRTCSNLIRKYLSPKWIPKECELDYCTFSKGKNKCCYNVQDYTIYEFDDIKDDKQHSDQLNLKWLIQQRYGLYKLEAQNQEEVTKRVMRDLLDEKTENCRLQLVVNDVHVLKFFVKRVKQDRLAKSMDIGQIDYRMSYAPEILIKVSNNIIMILKCPGSCIGVGFWNLVKWKKDSASISSGIDPYHDELFSMIHICDSFDLMSKVNLQFGIKKSQNTKIEKISIKLIESDGSIALYPIQKQQPKPSTTDTTDTTNTSTSNPRKRTLSDDTSYEYPESSPPPKKRKLN